MPLLRRNARRLEQAILVGAPDTIVSRPTSEIGRSPALDGQDFNFVWLSNSRRTRTSDRCRRLVGYRSSISNETTATDRSSNHCTRDQHAACAATCHNPDDAFVKPTRRSNAIDRVTDSRFCCARVSQRSPDAGLRVQKSDRSLPIHVGSSRRRSKEYGDQ